MGLQNVRLGCRRCFGTGLAPRRRRHLGCRRSLGEGGFMMSTPVSINASQASGGAIYSVNTKRKGAFTSFNLLQLYEQILLTIYFCPWTRRTPSLSLSSIVFRQSFFFFSNESDLQLSSILSEQIANIADDHKPRNSSAQWLTHCWITHLTKLDSLCVYRSTLSWHGPSGTAGDFP